MDLALSRQSGQELRNTYTINGIPDFAPLQRFFRSPVMSCRWCRSSHNLLLDHYLTPCAPPSGLATLRQRKVSSCSHRSRIITSLHHRLDLHRLSVSSHRRTGVSASWSLALQGRLSHITSSPDRQYRIYMWQVCGFCHPTLSLWIVYRNTPPGPSAPGHRLTEINFWRS